MSRANSDQWLRPEEASPRSSDQWLQCYREMTEKLYELRRQLPDLVTLSVPTLHPRYPVPADQVELVYHWSKGIPLPSWSRCGKAWARSLVFAFLETQYLFRLKIRFSSRLKALRLDRADLLIKAWTFSGASRNGSGDFYYGPLADQAQSQGIRSAFLYGDPRGRIGWQELQRMFKREGPQSLPEALFVPIWAPFLLWMKQLRSAFSLYRLASRASDPKLASVGAVCTVSCLQPSTLRNALYFYIVREAVRRFRPRTFLTLYEGQPWEKIAWHGAKAADPKVKILGYQHTVVMPHSLSLTSPNRPSWELSVPEAVLCLGEVTRRMMAEGHHPFGSRLIEFGTFRRTKESLQLSPPRPSRRTILVLPVGVLEEAVLLFDFATRLAKGSFQDRFIFRCHPVLPFGKVHPHLKEDPLRFTNIEVSGQRAVVRRPLAEATGRRAVVRRPLAEATDQGEITDDFKRSSAVLYHGSSAVLYSLLYGLKPLYVRFKELPDTDPLFEVEQWCERVTCVEEAGQALTRYGSSSEQGALKEWEPAFQYANRYLRPVDSASMDSFFKEVAR